MEWGRRASEIDRSRVEGHYFYASATGLYGTTIGLMTALVEGVAGKFEEAMGRSYEIDRDYDRGGPAISLGRYLYLMPWPKQDLKRSRRYLEEARERHPNRLVARFYLAETYWELGEKNKARAELERVLASTVDPEEAMERPHELARRRLREWFDRVS
jgi:tetratricopeptide (TPR) repeat protein